MAGPIYNLLSGIKSRTFEGEFHNLNSNNTLSLFLLVKLNRSYQTITMHLPHYEVSRCPNKSDAHAPIPHPLSQITTLTHTLSPSSLIGHYFDLVNMMPRIAVAANAVYSCTTLPYQGVGRSSCAAAILDLSSNCRSGW